MATRVDLGGGRYVLAEFSMTTGIAEFTDIKDEEVKSRLHSRAGSFDEIAEQMRVAIDYAKGNGWISKDKARHNKTLVTKTLERQKEKWRQQRLLQ